MSLSFKYNFHTHTYRCGHAIGNDEEYVKNAIKNDFKIIGFSDHAFLPGIVHPYMRGEYKELDGYISSIEALRAKYKKKIDIKLGFEIEYQERFYGYYRYLFLDKKFDFLILGQHCTYNEINEPVYYYNCLDNYEAINNYKNDVIEAMETGIFLYVAHPDIFFSHVTKITPEILHVCEEICDASIEYDVPLEVNLGGFGYANLHAQLKGAMPYPNHYFWEIAAKKGCKVIIGIDAHEPRSFENIQLINFGKLFIKTHDLNYIQDVNDLFNNYKKRIAKIF